MVIIVLVSVLFEKSARNEHSIERVLTKREDRMWERASAEQIDLFAPTSVLAPPPLGIRIQLTIKWLEAEMLRNLRKRQPRRAVGQLGRPAGTLMPWKAEKEDSRRTPGETPRKTGNRARPRERKERKEGRKMTVRWAGPDREMRKRR